MAEIKKVAVIGSGVMGSQIAAHVANAGYPVLLLDIVPKDAADRNMVAKGAIEKLQKADPAPFMHSRATKLVTPGNLEDDLGKLADVDWIVEAIVENPQIKSDLYKKIDPVRKKGSVVSSNTSTIPLHILTGGQSEDFARDFLITHFFNPPRYLRLLELVTSPKTRADAAALVSEFVDVRLGKGIVVCKDTPGFIANRIGTFWIQTAVNAAFDLGVTVEETDVVCGKPFGVPKTGIFGLLDLIGIDLMPLIAKSFFSTLPESDAYRKIYREPDLVKKMIADGYTGRKGKGGFYRLNTAGGGKTKEVIDLKTGGYTPAGKEKKIGTVESAGKNLRALCEADDKYGALAWAVISQTISYAASLVGEIADDILAIDQSMKWGYNFRFGPFEWLDQLGAGWFADRLKKEGKPVPAYIEKLAGRSCYKVESGTLQFMAADGSYKAVKRPHGVLLLEDIKRASKPVIKNGSASVWDIGDGVACLEFHTKMNAIDPDTLSLVQQAVDLLTKDRAKWKGMVVYNEGEHFSAGANLGLALFAINIGLYQAIDNMIAQGQQAFRAIKFAPFPTVAAPSGLALGGGYEITLHCAATQAHAETYIGLVEVGVGIIPGWGGCAQMLGRAFNAKKRFGGPIPPIAQVFETVSVAKMAKSALEAQDLMYLRTTDGVTFNRERLLFDAKQKVLTLAKDYKPPEEYKYRLPGKTGQAALNLVLDGFAMLGKALPHDVTVSKALGLVLTGAGADVTGEMTEADILKLEQQEFSKLLRTEPTRLRIEHMLETGKPLRN